MSNVVKLPKGKARRQRPKKPRWYKMEAFWEKDAEVAMQVGEEDIVLCGWVPPHNEVAVCIVPGSITQQQGLALQKILEANFRAPILVLTNNTQLVKLKQISNAEKDRIMKEGSDGIVHVSKEGDEEEAPPRGEEQREGGGIRALDSVAPANDLRPAEADQGDGEGGESKEIGGAAGATEDIGSPEE